MCIKFISFSLFLCLILHIFNHFFHFACNIEPHFISFSTCLVSHLFDGVACSLGLLYATAYVYIGRPLCLHLFFCESVNGHPYEFIHFDVKNVDWIADLESAKESINAQFVYAYASAWEWEREKALHTETETRGHTHIHRTTNCVQPEIISIIIIGKCMISDSIADFHFTVLGIRINVCVCVRWCVVGRSGVFVLDVLFLHSFIVASSYFLVVVVAVVVVVVDCCLLITYRFNKYSSMISLLCAHYIVYTLTIRTYIFDSPQFFSVCVCVCFFFVLS